MDQQPFQAGPASNQPADLQTQINSLHRLVTSLLILVIVISGTLLIFLLRLSRNTSADLEALRPAYTNFMAGYQRNGPVIDEAVKRLQDAARTNADVAGIIAKYGLKPASATAAPSTAKK